MKLDSFSETEETISFYTRNDFAIINALLAGDTDSLWSGAHAAYNDNKNIIEEFRNGQRTVNSDYDIKWIEILQKRLISSLDRESKEKIIKTACKDIDNILNAMRPAERKMLLYRTAWDDCANCAGNCFPYSHQYKSLRLRVNDSVTIKTISSTSVTPYMEKNADKAFYRYEITVPAGNNILELDKFVCHNENGEVLLPPMKFKVTDIIMTEKDNCKGIIKIEYSEQLHIKFNVSDYLPAFKV